MVCSYFNYDENKKLQKSKMTIFSYTKQFKNIICVLIFVLMLTNFTESKDSTCNVNMYNGTMDFENIQPNQPRTNSVFLMLIRIIIW